MAKLRSNPDEAAKDTPFNTNRAFFDAAAGRYDDGREAYFAHDRGRVHRELSSHVLPHVAKEPLVLDIGCGTGFYSLALAGLGCRRFHCLDLNDAFLEQTRANLEANNAAVEVELMRSDLASLVRGAAELPAFDLIVVGSVLQYIPEYPALLTALAHAQPHACFYITSPQLGTLRRFPFWEEAMARADYFCHRLVHRQPKVGKKAQEGAVLNTVDANLLDTVFSAQGYACKRLVYTTYHTAFFNQSYRFCKRLAPNTGSYFSLVAHKKAAAA